MKKSFLLLIAVLFTSLNTLAITPSAAAEHTDFNAVVFLKIPALDDSGTVTGFCNGTLISNQMLITAAHCVAGSTLNRGSSLGIEIGHYRYRQTNEGKVIRTGYFTFLKIEPAVQVRFPAGVSFDSRPNQIPPEKDYALILLQQPINLSNDFNFPKVWNQSLSYVKILNPFVVSVNPVEYISSSDTKQFAYLDRFTNSLYSAESKSTSRVAPGDSGAPLFATINDQIYLIGVTKGRAETFFSNWDVFAIWADRIPAF